MPLYQVRDDAKNVVGVFESVSPSKAACKAFNSQRRKEPPDSSGSMKLFVATEGKRFLVGYMVRVEPLEKQTPHESKHGITTATRATRIADDDFTARQVSQSIS